MSWRRMTYPSGAEVCPIGPLTTLSVHAPHSHFSHWSWAVERYTIGLIQPGEVADPRGHGRQLAEAAAVEWFETGLAQLRMLAAGEQYAASLSNRRARQNAMPWYWWRDRLRPRLAHDLPIRIEIGQTIDGYHWCAGPIQGTACIEANARNFATSAAERLLRIGLEALTWRAAA